MSETPALAEITVLDFSTVGPASRCSRILADYGATVVKVGAPPKKSGVQIQPVFHAYSAGRGMKQVRLDLKAAEGREALLRLAARADVVIESYRPGVAQRLRIGVEDLFQIVRRAASGARVLARVLRSSQHPSDHPIDPSFPEGRYLKAILASVFRF